MGIADVSTGAINSRVWRRGRFVGSYLGRDLRPVEITLLLQYRDVLANRVLELGCGAGRITGYLIDLGGSVTAMDVAPAMLQEARSRYPRGDFREGDIRDLSAFAEAEFDAIVAGCNLLDILDDEARRTCLRQIAARLAPGGILIMSSHNRAYLPRVRRPAAIRTSSARGFAADVVRAPVSVARHRRLRALERDHPGYAIVSDGAHAFSLVHYFISSEAQRRQFEDLGFELLAALDLDGRPLIDGYEAPDCPEIHYVARRAC